MKPSLAPAALLLLSLAARAADLQDAAAGVPAESIDMIYVVLLLLLLVGGIAAFLLYYLWRDEGEKKKPQ